MSRYLIALSLGLLALTGLVAPAGTRAQNNRLCFDVPGITD